LSPRARSRAQLVGAAVLFSTGGAALKACTLDAWQVASFRGGIAALAVLALIPASRRRFTLRMAVVAAAYAATALLFVRANKLTTAAATIFLQSASPLYIALLGPFLLGERPRRRDLACMAGMAAGLVLIFLGLEEPARVSPDPVQGNLLGAACGVTVALMMIGLRWLGREGGGNAAPAAVVLGNLLAFAVALPFAWPVSGARALDWAVLGYLGVFQIAVAYALLLAAMRHVSALDASLLLFVEPVLSPVWAWLLHGERPGPLVLAGGAVILGATALWAWLDARAGGR
jgi:drug/metabolite transporter (DMT)-like permease